MTRKGFASDFDGTLHLWEHDDEYLVSPAIKAAIERFRAEGGLFGVCTGRPLNGLTTQTAGEIDFDFYIAATGATLHDRELKELWSKHMPREVARDIYNGYAPLATGHMPLACAANDYWVIGGDPGEWPVNRVASYDEIPGPFIGYAMETELEETSARAAAEINERFAGVAQAYQNLNSIDVVPVGCSKGTGLQRAKEHFGIELMAGMGDSFNDIPLLEAADISYTFDYCPEEVQAAATYVVPDAEAAIRDFMAR